MFFTADTFLGFVFWSDWGCVVEWMRQTVPCLMPPPSLCPGRQVPHTAGYVLTEC